MKDQHTTREQRKAVAKMLRAKAHELGLQLSIVTEDYFVRVKCFTTEQKMDALKLISQFGSIHHMESNVYQQDGTDVQVLLL